MILIAAAFASIIATAKTETRYIYTEASELTLVNRLFPDTPNPYVRIDTVRFKGFTKGENNQVRMSTGIAVAFTTDARSISILTEYGNVIGHPNDTNGISARGYDLYIRKDGEWLYAASKAPGDKHMGEPMELISNLDGTEHECLLYLPLNCEEYSVKIGVPTDASLNAMLNPFRHLPSCDRNPRWKEPDVTTSEGTILHRFHRMFFQSFEPHHRFSNIPRYSLYQP